MRKLLLPLVTLTLLVACSTTPEGQQVGSNPDVTASQENKTFAHLAIGGVT